MEIKWKELKKPWLGKYAGITIIPYVFIYLGNKSKKQIDILKNHESIHAVQVQDEMDKWGEKAGRFIGNPIGWIVWYWKYIMSYLKNLLGSYFTLKAMSPTEAYMNIPAEKEAYTNEKNLYYLEKRPKFAVKKYI